MRFSNCLIFTTILQHIIKLKKNTFPKTIKKKELSFWTIPSLNVKIEKNNSLARIVIEKDFT
jgi:hypothetical protein